MNRLCLFLLRSEEGTDCSFGRLAAVGSREGAWESRPEAPEGSGRDSFVLELPIVSWEREKRDYFERRGDRV